MRPHRPGTMVPTNRRRPKQDNESRIQNLQKMPSISRMPPVRRETRYEPRNMGWPNTEPEKVANRIQ